MKSSNVLTQHCFMIPKAIMLNFKQFFIKWPWYLDVHVISLNNIIVISSFVILEYSCEILATKPWQKVPSGLCSPRGIHLLMFRITQESLGCSYPPYLKLNSSNTHSVRVCVCMCMFISAYNLSVYFTFFCTKLESAIPCMHIYVCMYVHI